ncbi:MAG: adenine glycosylase [Coriobacteriales bacterium]|nr:adenine glycosylase [Coriobacteriales bacterium]
MPKRQQSAKKKQVRIKLPDPEPISFEPQEFRAKIRHLARPLWRELPWRNIHDAYRVWLSEVMLQQTQVSRVLARWQLWLDRFPHIYELASASDAEVLEAWQGMGYNRRALALHETAQIIVRQYRGSFPHHHDELLKLPGIGPSTAAGIRVFAFDEPDIYLETNVRTVFIYELFPQAAAVSDSALIPLIRATCPGAGEDIRSWYYALLDYGSWLKHEGLNASQRSAGYVRQTPFEGSHRQKRAETVRILLAARKLGTLLDTQKIIDLLIQEEITNGRPVPSREEAADILSELEQEGFCTQTPYGWAVGREVQ